MLAARLYSRAVKMGDSPGIIGNEEGEGFPFLLAIFAVIAHLCIIIVVMYYSCCRHGCSCKITVGSNSTETSTPSDHSDADQLVTSHVTTRRNSTEPPAYSSAPGTPHIQPSIMSRVRDRIYGHNPDRERQEQLQSQDSEPVLTAEPPPYSEITMPPGASGGGHVNEGAIFLDLPTYQDCLRSEQDLNDGTGVDKPPKYEDVVKTV